MFDALAVMLAIAVPTIVAALAFAWWFRAGNTKASRRPEFTYSGRIELIVWGIPLLVILFLGGVIWVGSHRQDPSTPLASANSAVEIDVVALDWKWLFIDRKAGIASVNRLVIPVGTPIRFRLTSGSVMNAFFVPRLGSMIYAMNGMETELNLLADHSGRYDGMSSHYSGSGFADMAFVVDAVPVGAYRSWVRRTRERRGAKLNVGTYAALARQGSAAAAEFGQVDPSLFDAVVSQKIPPTPGQKALLEVARK